MTQYARVDSNRTIVVGGCKISHMWDGFSCSAAENKYLESTRQDWERFIDLTDGKGNYLLPYAGFLIERGDKKVLVDLGMGPKDVIEELFSGYGVECGHYLDGLAEVGASPEDITDVFITHMHMDHTGWATVREDGKWRLTFPNATYWVNQKEWDYWKYDAEQIGGPVIDRFFKESFIEPLDDVIRFADDGQEIAPGLTAHNAFGHSPGMMALKLRTEDGVVWFTADLFHSVAQFTERGWHFYSDCDFDAASEGREKMLPELLKDEVILLANGHFANSVFGTLEEKDGILVWTSLAG